MKRKEKESSKSGIQVRRFFWTSVAVTCLCLAYGVLAYYVDCRLEFGELFGALTAWFSGLAFAGIIFTILQQRTELKYQRKELRLTRKEFKLTRGEFETQNYTLRMQRFDNTFFNLLTQHNRIVQKVYFKEPGLIDMSMVTGHNAFKAAYNLIRGHGGNYLPEFRVEIGLTREHNFETLSVEQRETYVIKVADDWYRKNHHSTNLYFLSLKRILKFIHRSSLLESDHDRNSYVSLLKDQLSYHEKVVILYALMLPDDWLKGISFYVKKYGLLEGLKTENLVTPYDKQMFDQWADVNEPPD